MAFALSNLKEYLPGFRQMYLKKRDLIYSMLCETKFTPHKPKGSYFIMADIPGTKNDLETAEFLVRELGVATIPPSVFYGKSSEGGTMLRLCFAKQDETIINGINRLKIY
jgi:aspartate/methionine/tyrosine aminotransferase